MLITKLLTFKIERTKSKRRKVQRSLFLLICFILLCFSISVSIADTPNPPAGKKWEAVSNLTDDFNSWDSGKWQYSLWDYTPPNKMLSSQVSFANGNLQIRAELHSDPERWMKTCRIMSNAQINYPMYTECRMRSSNISAYNTFWLNNGDANNRNEIDVCENNANPTNNKPDWPWTLQSQIFHVVNGDVFRTAGNFDNRNLSAGNPGRGVKWNEAYHIIGVWWKDARNFQYYLDGEPAGSVVSSRDFTLSLNIYFDQWTNEWDGFATKESLGDNSRNCMYVDYVRTYRLVNGTGETSAPTPAPTSPPNLTPIPGIGDVITIEAESFNNTGGTFDDGIVPLGVNINGTAINFINAGDWVDYNISVSNAGEYTIEYQISTPEDNAQIQFLLNNTIISTDNVTNNGQWDVYVPLKAANNVNLSTGSAIIRLLASGSNTWQWNLDKFILTKITTTPTEPPQATDTPIPTAPPVALGDVNNDGSIDIVDALLIAQYYVGLNPQNFDVNRADTNCNGSADIVDALIIAQYYVGLITSFC